MTHEREPREAIDLRPLRKPRRGDDPPRFGTIVELRRRGRPPKGQQELPLGEAIRCGVAEGVRQVLAEIRRELKEAKAT